MRTIRWVFILTLVATISMLGPHLAYADPVLNVPSVALGSDYFQTQAGTSFDFGGPIGIVNFMGLPIGPGQTDTIVQRQADATINGGPIPLQIVALSLQSTAPVNVGGSFFDVFVTLDPPNLANDTGQMTIMGTTAGGTFNSFFDVFFDAQFVPIGSGTPFDVPGNVLLSQNGAAWGPTPSAGTLLVPGPDDGTSADQAANFHSGLDPLEVDFFVVPPLIENSPTGAHHVVSDTPVPEPSTLLLLGSGLAGLAYWRRKQAA